MESIATPLIVKGIRGLSRGETYSIQKGETIIVGRSRECDFSLRRSMAYLVLTPQERVEQRAFQAVSRRHCRISYLNEKTIEIEDFSRHGTFVNGKGIRRVIITDAREKPYRITLGVDEELTFE